MKHRTGWTPHRLLSLVLTCHILAASATEPNTGLDTRRTFSIPAQPLASALLAFSSQADVQVMTASSDLHDRVSSAVSGERPAREALDRLLSGTGMRAHVISDSAVSIEPNPVIRPRR